jgi:hypothetical protein
MKLREWIYQATMRMNVLSSVMLHVIEVDAVHICGRQNCCNDMARKQQLYRGHRQLHGIRWRIRELGRSIGLLKWYVKTSSEKQELAKGSMEVGLTGSTSKTGKPSTRQPSLYELWLSRGSGQQRCDSARYNADTQKSGEHHV